MNYAEWNSKIGDHFFGADSGGRRVVMCVTRDTLSEVSGLPPDEALQDFVSSVLEGPVLNRIRGCTLIETKVQCCLHVDPFWAQHRSDDTVNPPYVQELQDLSVHNYWEDYNERLVEGRYDYPPYLAYLAAFVLAWTERRHELSGLNYYDTVLDLLDKDRERWKERPQFFRKYRRNDRELTMNDVWADLKKFCEDRGRAEFFVPDAVLKPGHYVDTPKFLGLMKAADLRNLERLFAAMEEAAMLSPDAIPPFRPLIERVLNFDRHATYLSHPCLDDLKDAISTADNPLAEAYGRLLQSKYRNFDGLLDEEEWGRGTSRPRTARLLRVMERNGNIKLVCRLRSEAALKKLALEEDADYVFSGGGIDASARWNPGSEWFTPFVVAIDDPMGSLQLACPALRVGAAMIAKDYVVLHNPGLYFLAGCKVEVDEVEKGRQYTLLSKGNAAPELPGVQVNRMNTPCPMGISCWSFSVPTDATSETWSECLPPLLEENRPRPRLSFSGFRLEPRANRFPVGLPVRIRSSLDKVELVMKCDNGAPDLQKEDEGAWVLIARQPGDVNFSLRDPESQRAPEGWQDQRISFHSLDDEGAGMREFPMDLLDETEPPPYPEAWIELEGGTIDPRYIHSNSSRTYLATAVPTVKLTSRNLRTDNSPKLTVNGRPYALNGSFNAIQLSGWLRLPQVQPDQRLEIAFNDGGTLLRGLVLRFSREPEIQVECASSNQSKPSLISGSLLRATVRGERGLTFDWEVGRNSTRQASGRAEISGSGIWNGSLVGVGDAGLEAGKTYEVRFGFAGRFSVTQWFRFQNPGGGAGGTREVVPPRRPIGGFNSMENAFRDLNLPGDKKEGKP